MDLILKVMTKNDAFCLQLDFISPGCGNDHPESELSSHSGSESEYCPSQNESSFSDKGDLILDKASSLKESSSDNVLQDSDTGSRQVDGQEKGKCTIQKHKNLYVKRKNKKQNKNKIDEVTTTVTIKACTKREDNKRLWDKKHYCLYCGRANAKIARHLEGRHMEIKDVAYAFSFPSGSKDRKALLEELRNKGDFEHNAKVLKKGRGQLVTWRQPSVDASVKDYLPCTYCYGMFAKKQLFRHHFSCRCKKSCVDDDKLITKRSVQSGAACLLSEASSSTGCQKIINNMREDDVSFHIRSDSLICEYGESLYAKHGDVKSKHHYIAQRLRELGRFMLCAKNMDKTVSGLGDLCTPSKFQIVVNVAKKLIEFSPGKNKYGKHSTAAKIGLCLRGAVEVLIGQALMNDDDIAEKRAKTFLELLEKNWKNEVNVKAHQTIQEKRWSENDDISLTKSVITLRDHLRMMEDKAREELTQQSSLRAYKMLNEAVLVQVIIFNKRREGEAACFKLQIYKTASTNPINKDIYETLSPLEKELSKLLTRIEMRGKSGKMVPVFFTERMKESIDLLIKRRDEVYIPPENPYLFARPGAMTNMRGCDCLRKHAEESKAENPELLRSPQLRKQVATLYQLLDLSEQELEQVARFMGHDIRVHQDFYRQTDKTFQIAKISKLLFAMEQGPGTLEGKNLNTIDLSVCGMYAL